MKYFILFFIILFPLVAFAQLTVTSVSPANGAVNVPLSTTLSITFSEAIDSTKGMGYTNISQASDPIISPDLRTFSSNITLSPNTAYFFIFINNVAVGGSRLQTPFLTYFTTGSAFPTPTISGVVQSGQTSVSPAYSMVFISLINPMKTEDTPDFVMATLADASGNFTIPYVRNGNFYIIAAKDVDGVEGIDPGEGNAMDVVSNVDSLSINNASVTGIVLGFMGKKTFSAARDLAATYSTGLPAANYLRQVQGENVDSTGKARNWQFSYVATIPTDGHQINVDMFETKIQPLDTSFGRWLLQADTFNPSLAVDASVFIANVENAGGRVFRQTTPAGGYFNCTVSLGQLIWFFYAPGSLDPSGLYWGASYIKDWWVGDQFHTDGMMFIGDFTTGAILNVTSVKDSKQNRPGGFTLYQNYPNPFNPATTIRYELQTSTIVTLKVFDVLGREVATLVNQHQPAGRYTSEFKGAHLPSGVYIYRLQAGQYSESKKMLLTK